MGRNARRIAVVASGLLLAAGLTGTATATATAAPAPSEAIAGTCNFDSPITARSHSVGSATVQLRYSTTTRCAWGRIVNAQVGDEVWVQRRYPDGHDDEYLPGASLTYVQYGSDTHTDSYYDGGVQMRACAATATVNTTCTGWY